MTAARILVVDDEADNLDAFRFKEPENFVGHVRVLATQELLCVLYDRDAAAEPAKHLAELQTDIAAPKNQQVLRHFLQLHDRRGIEGPH